MAAANTSATKTAADQVKAATEQVQAAADQATQNAAKIADQAVAQMKASSEKARQNSVEMTEKTIERFEEGGKQFEENAARIQKFNAAITESSKAGTRAVVDQVETASKGLFDLQRKFAGEVKVDWVKETATTQIQFAEDVTKAWAKAARALVK